MAVTLNHAALALLLESGEGPVGRELRRKAEAVVLQAQLNASGPVIGIESTDLHRGIQYEIQETATGPAARVFTPAMSTWHGQPFSYPAYQDQTQGRPWLTLALRTVFPG